MVAGELYESKGVEEKTEMNRKRYRLAILLCLVIAPFALPSHSFAKTDVVYASYKYVMGDNDTKNDAKRICFIEAKRRCLEKVGTYIESETEVKNFNLTKDEIRTYAAALTKVEVANEEIKFEGESIAIYMTVKAEVDTNTIGKRIEQIRADRSLQTKITNQQQQIDALEKKIRGLQSELAATDYKKAIEIRKERKAAFDTLDEVSSIKYDMSRKAQLAVENVEILMTPEEVIRVAGPPRAIRYPHLNYGHVWVVFENGVVNCIVDAGCFKYILDYEGYMESVLNPCGPGRGIIKPKPQKKRSNPCLF